MSMLRIYSGARPTNPDRPTGTLLAEMEITLIPHPTQNAVYEPNTVITRIRNTGTAGYYILTFPPPLPPLVGTVGRAGCSMNIASCHLIQDDDFSISSLIVNGIRDIKDGHEEEKQFIFDPNESFIYWEREGRDYE